MTVMAELMNTAEQVKNHGEHNELEIVRMFNSKGKLTLNWARVVRVELAFIDQAQAHLTRDEFAKLKNEKFKRRPEKAADN